MRRSGSVLALVFALVSVAGCSLPVPTQPTPPVAGPSPTPVSPAPPIPKTDPWLLTTSLVSVTEPDSCKSPTAPEPGMLAVWSLGVTRSGDAVALELIELEQEGSHWIFNGLVRDSEFTAVGSQNGATLCRGVRVNFQLDMKVSGRFSEDGLSLSAEELDSYRLPNGDTIDYKYTWIATRK